MVSEGLNMSKSGLENLMRNSIFITEYNILDSLMFKKCEK